MKEVEVIDCIQHEDERGWVAWPVISHLLVQGKISDLHVPSMKPGAVRGNHYHQHTNEYAFVLSGPCRALFYNNTTGEQWEFVVTQHKPKLFKIHPNVTHAFKNESNQDIFLVCYNESLQERSDTDTLRRVILDAGR